MTIDEAIRHCEEVASKCEFETDWGMGNHFIDRSGVADVIKCGEEHRQLAEWLKILKSAKFEYDEAWRTITHPTPDVTYADKQRAQMILDKFRNSLGAISTLQTQDVHDINVGDMISRQAAIDALDKRFDPVPMEQTTEILLLRKDLRDLPPVQPQPNTGHWIYEKRKRLINETDEGAEYVTDYWCKCSKCGGDFGYRKMKDAFCKYCGAKMIEPQAESEDKE